MTDSDHHVAPTHSQERIKTVDILRGFALVGVVLANFQRFVSWDVPAGSLDAAAVWAVEHLISGKFYRLFAFLFGLGFALQMSRLEARGVRFVPLYLRRLGILFIIGVLHGVLFLPSDILTLFAQFGVLLLIIRNVSNRSLVIIAVGCLLASNIYYYVSTDFADFRQVAVEQEVPSEQQQLDEEVETERVRLEGSYGEVVAWNARHFWEWRSGIRSLLATLGEEFLMFLCGLYVGRCHLVEKSQEHRSFIRRAMLWSLGIGLIAYPIFQWLSSVDSHPVYGHLAVSVRVVMRDIQPAALALFYAAALVLLLDREGWKQRLQPLAQFGRMALTNYMATSVIVTTLFLDYGFGLYGKVSVISGLGIAATACALMIVISNWWMRRHLFGPAEWVWRSLTYGKRQPFRR